MMRRLNSICSMRQLSGVMVAVILAAVLPGTAQAAKARTWYVSLASGTDTTCVIGGTSASPFMTIAFALGCAGNRDTISIDGSPTAYIYVQPSTLVINKKLTLVGTGSPQPEISGNNLIQVLHNLNLPGPANILHISNLTIDGGLASMGGGIFNEGTLTLDGVTVNFSKAGLGGGIYNTGSLTAINTTISDNTATGIFTGACTLGAGIVADGGGIYNASTGSLTLSGVTISNNTATSTGCAAGGGIYNLGTLNLTTSSMVSTNHVIAGLGPNNAGGFGGGIYNLDGDVTVDHSTVSSNTAGSSSGNSIGGGIAHVGSGTLTLQNDSTVSGNTSQFGGGIYNSNFATTNIFGPLSITGNAASQGGGIYNYGLLSPVGVVVFKKGVTTFSGNVPDQCGPASMFGTYTYNFGTTTPGAQCPF